MKYLRENYKGALVVKLSDRWVSGLPDVMFIHNEKIKFFELKSERGELSKIQILTHAQIKFNRFDVYTIKTMEELKGVI